METVFLDRFNGTEHCIKTAEPTFSIELFPGVRTIQDYVKNYISSAHVIPLNSFRKSRNTVKILLELTNHTNENFWWRTAVDKFFVTLLFCCCISPRFYLGLLSEIWRPCSRQVVINSFIVDNFLEFFIENKCKQLWLSHESLFPQLPRMRNIYCVLRQQEVILPVWNICTVWRCDAMYFCMTICISHINESNPAHRGLWKNERGCVRVWSIVRPDRFHPVCNFTKVSRELYDVYNTIDWLVHLLLLLIN